MVRKKTLLVDEDRLVTALKEVSHALASLVEDAGVFAVQPVHSLGECAEWRLDDEMVVIHRQAVFVETPAKPLGGRREQRQKLQPVAVLSEDVLPFIASGCDVPEGTLEFKSERSGLAPEDPSASTKHAETPPNRPRMFPFRGGIGPFRYTV